MLVLTRKRGERIDVGEGTLIVTVLLIEGNRVRLGFEADADIPIKRMEIPQAPLERHEYKGQRP